MPASDKSPSASQRYSSQGSTAHCSGVVAVGIWPEQFTRVLAVPATHWQLIQPSANASSRSLLMLCVHRHLDRLNAVLLLSSYEMFEALAVLRTRRLLKRSRYAIVEDLTSLNLKTMTPVSAKIQMSQLCGPGMGEFMPWQNPARNWL